VEGSLSLSASMPLPLRGCRVPTRSDRLYPGLPRGEPRVSRCRGVDDERRLDPPSQAAEPGTREAPRPIRSVGEKLSENEPPGLFGYVELEFIERLARRFAADKAPSVVGTQRRPHMRHPPVTARTTNRASGSSAQLLTHVEVPTLQCGLCREDSAHGLRLGQEIDRVPRGLPITKLT